MENTKERLEREGQPEPPVDYFLVVAHYADWFVSREMAQAIEASLTQTPAPPWVIWGGRDQFLGVCLLLRAI